MSEVGINIYNNGDIQRNKTPKSKTTSTLGLNLNADTDIYNLNISISTDYSTYTTRDYGKK